MYNTSFVKAKCLYMCLRKEYTKTLTKFIDSVGIVKGIMDSFYFLLMLMCFFLKFFFNEHVFYNKKNKYEVYF